MSTNPENVDMSNPSFEDLAPRLRRLMHEFTRASGGFEPPKFIYLGHEEQEMWFAMVRSGPGIIDPIGTVKGIGERRFMGAKVIFTEERQHLAVGS